MGAGSYYVRRLAVMLGIAMPSIVVLLATLEVARGAGRGAVNVAVGAAGLVYVWGVISGALVSLAHTAIIRQSGRGAAFSIGLGAALGLVGGALTPTALTGLLEPSAIVLGGVAGLLYGFLVTWPSWRSRPRHA